MAAKICFLCSKWVRMSLKQCKTLLDDHNNHLKMAYRIEISAFFYITLVVNMFQIQNWRLYGDSKWPPNMFILLKLGLNIFKTA